MAPESEMHNSPPDHPARIPVEQLLRDCEFRRSRHSGPGGQHRNKVETAVEVIHVPTGLIGFAAEQRSQAANRRVAVERLRMQLAVHVRVVRSAEVHPSALWQQRCRHQKIVCSEQHADFPAMISEALDALSAKEFDPTRASGALGCTPTQLIRFVGRVSEALEWVNAERASRGLRRLHI